jgi:hypothetical protein
LLLGHEAAFRDRLIAALPRSAAPAAGPPASASNAAAVIMKLFIVVLPFFSPVSMSAVANDSLIISAAPVSVISFL